MKTHTVYKQGAEVGRIEYIDGEYVVWASDRALANFSGEGTVNSYSYVPRQLQKLIDDMKRAGFIVKTV